VACSDAGHFSVRGKEKKPVSSQTGLPKTLFLNNYEITNRKGSEKLLFGKEKKPWKCFLRSKKVSIFAMPFYR